MESNEHMQDDTKYFYSVDTIQQLREGKSEKKLFSNDFKDFERLLTQTGSILIPKAIGIYQIGQPTYDDPKKMEMWKGAREYSNKATDLSIETEWGIVDSIDRDLIHIIYNSKDYPTDLVKSILFDSLERITLSSHNNYPNFYKKEILLVYELLMESHRLRGEKDPEDVDPEVLNSSFTRLKPKAKEVLKKLQHFGLTRSEWYDINSFFLFS